MYREVLNCQMIATANAIVPKKTAPPLPTCLTRKSDVDSPTPVVRTLVSQKMAVTSGTLVSSVECRVFDVIYGPGRGSVQLARRPGATPAALRVGDGDEVNMKDLVTPKLDHGRPVPRPLAWKRCVSERRSDPRRRLGSRPVRYPGQRPACRRRASAGS